MREDPDEAGSLEPLNSNESSVQGRSPHAYLAQSSSHRHLRDGLWGNQNGTKLTELTEIQMFFLNKCPLYLPLWFISRVLEKFFIKFCQTLLFLSQGKIFHAAIFFSAIIFSAIF